MEIVNFIPEVFVNLKAYTQPVDTEMDMQAFIAYCARVSNPKNQHNHLTAGQLLKYLKKHKHWSPFEMANLVIEVVTTRDIARQILRHRSFSFQEFSQRYAEVDLPSMIREPRLQDSKNRQSSIETDNDALWADWYTAQQEVWRHSAAAYQWALDSGIAKEVARAVLPEGMTTSRMYINGTVRSWLHYCHIRMQDDTQKEHRLIARACYDILVDKVPALKEVEM